MGTQLFIKDEDLLPLKDKTVVITGASSGIGLATAQLLLSLGANVVSGDLNPSPITHPNHNFVVTDVTSWPSQKALFAAAAQRHPHIDHVFANAGIGGRANYLTSKFDAEGELLEPTTKTYEINQRGMINTAYLGMHYFRNQSPPGGSVVCTASASSFQRFGMTDYTATKHAIFGFVRGTVANLLEQPELGIRINAIGPSWTMTGLVPQDLVDMAKVETQSPEAVARNVAFLFADESRNGDFFFSQGGRYYEIESRFLPIAKEIEGSGAELEGLKAVAKEATKRQQAMG